ncbi:MAG: uncharacterized protein KVP18_004050 [Porospora cf. gigantea A]|uniref:uncharacterized protein n=1 Tax=Porospora cf. gigantea A TaxID=2853593 RepID=UPI0035593B49|nr:MAG: hypothetical protein KVP18_004050 [Porospora cf. gigantea A]
MTVALLKHFDGHLLYAPGVPLLALRLFQMEKTVRRQLPDAAKQLYNVSLNLQVFTHQWLMSFFAYFVDVATLAHIWDCFFMDGWKTLCRVATGIVKVFHPFLYTQDQDTVLKLVQDSRRLVSCLHRCDDISERLPCLDSEALASVSSKVLVDVAHVCILAVSRSARQLLRISYGFKVTNSMLSRYSLDFQTTKLLESARMPVLSYLQAGAISEPECSHTLLSSRRQEMIKDSWCSGEPLRGLIFTTGRDLTPSSWVVVIDTRNMIARDWPAQICPARPRDLLASGHPRVCFPPTETSAFASAEEYAHPSVDSLLQRLFLCSLFDTDSPMNGFLEGTATASYLYMSFRHFSDLVAMLIDVDQTVSASGT